MTAILSRYRAPLPRRALLARIGIIAAAALSLPPRRVAAQQKVSKAEAKYQDQPKGQQRCEICVNFQPPDQCRFVDGKIDKQGWCQFFAARENAR
jgi:hypothetical protein